MILAELSDANQSAKGLGQFLPPTRASVVVNDRAQRIAVLRIDLKNLLPALKGVPFAAQLLREEYTPLVVILSSEACCGPCL